MAECCYLTKHFLPFKIGFSKIEIIIDLYYWSTERGLFMATIKDVARVSGVSVTTVSIIINGKAQERKISDATCKRVQEAMRDLGYQPNLSARRLRYQGAPKPVIVFFWPIDYRTSILASFLNALQLEIKELNFDCELMVQTYENDHLDQYGPLILKNGYSGMIIGASSYLDLEYLESLSPQMPLVLINRSSERFSTVGVDNNQVGFLAARQFQKKGYQEAVIFASEHSYVATGQRTQAFLYACSQLGINVMVSHILKCPNTIGGGCHAAEQYCRFQNPPKAIFCDSDTIAIGALNTFYRMGRRVPEDTELLTIAMLDPEHAEYAIPPLSVIEMPNREIGKQIIDLLHEQITMNSLEPKHITMNAELIFRDSFPL